MRTLSDTSNIICTSVSNVDYSMIGTFSAHLRLNGVLSVKCVSPCWWNG